MQLVNAHQVAVGHRRRIFARKAQRRGSWRAVILAGALSVAAVGVAGCVKFAASSSAPAVSAADVPMAYSARLMSENVAVIDGETLRLSGQVVHLDGVAAPRRGETCRLADDCASAAVLHLAALVRDRQVACVLSGRDGSGRPLAQCHAGATDLGREEVASGWAFAENASLSAAEQDARHAHRGLWSIQ